MSSNEFSQPVELSIVIPAYNEARRIGPTLSSVQEYLASLPYASEVIIVNDGSRDDTARVVREVRKEMSSLSLLSLSHNVGKGGAVRAGMLAAVGKYRVFMDADNSTDIRNWAACAPLLNSGYDFVVSSRRAAGAHVAVRQPWYREALGVAFRSLAGLIAPTGVTDSQNGFKAFTADAAQRVFGPLQTNGWAFDVEVLRRARKQGLRIAEIPVEWRNDEHSLMQLSGMFRMLWDLLEMRLRV